MTAELLPIPLTEDEAQRLTDRIELRLVTIAETIEKVIPLIEQAKAGDAHTALGYRGWPEYVADKFGGLLSRLQREDRQPLVQLLSDQGMSTRAIAPVVGVSQRTVANDLASGEQDCSTPVTGTDGKTYIRNGRATTRGMIETSEAVNATNPPRPRKVVAAFSGGDLVCLTPEQDFRRGMKMLRDILRHLVEDATPEHVDEIRRVLDRASKKLPRGDDG